MQCIRPRRHPGQRTREGSCATSRLVHLRSNELGNANMHIQPPQISTTARVCVRLRHKKPSSRSLPLPLLRRRRLHLIAHHGLHLRTGLAKQIRAWRALATVSCCTAHILRSNSKKISVWPTLPAQQAPLSPPGRGSRPCRLRSRRRRQWR